MEVAPLMGVRPGRSDGKGGCMKMALDVSSHFWHVLIALIVITLVALSISQCPSLGFEKDPAGATQVAK
jgi:hypothetical protein